MQAFQDPSCQTIKIGGSSGLGLVFLWHGLSLLVHLNISLTIEHYNAQFVNHLHPFLDTMQCNNNGLYQQYNKPCHQAQLEPDDIEPRIGLFILKSFLVTSKLITWLLYPPGMSPIKHLQDRLKKSIYMQDPALTNIGKLRTAIKTAQLNISPEVF